MWKNVKLSAKETLKDNWLESIFSISVPVFIFIITWLFLSLMEFSIDFLKSIDIYTPLTEKLHSYLNIVLVMIAIYFICSLAFGIIKYFWNKSFNKNNLNLVFDSFKKGNFSKYSSVANMHFGLHLIAFIVPVAVIVFKIISISKLKFQPSIFNEPVLYQSIAMIVISVLLIYVIFVFLQGTFLMSFIFLSDEEMSYSASCKLSRKIMRGSKIDSANFVLSFIPLFLLSILIIPIIFIIPYFLQCRCEYAKEILNRYSNRNRKLENTIY